MSGKLFDYLALVTVCGLAGCEATPAPKPTELLPATTGEQKITAARTYWQCLASKARAVDDHISDAMTVARAIKGSCPFEMAQYAKATEGGRPVEYWTQEINVQRSIELDTALSSVLAERKQRN